MVYPSPWDAKEFIANNFFYLHSLVMATIRYFDVSFIRTTWFWTLRYQDTIWADGYYCINNMFMFF